MSCRLIAFVGFCVLAGLCSPTGAQDINSNYILQNKLSPAQTLDASNIFSTRLETSYSAAVDNRPNGRGKVQGLDTTATFLVTPNQWLSIGGGLNYGDGSKQFGVGQDAAGASVLGGSAHTSALLGFGLATVNLSRELSASFFAGYGKFSTSESLDYATSRVSWKYDGETRILGAGLAYKHTWENFFVVPGVQIGFTEVNNQDYKAIQRNKITGVETTLDGLGYRDDQTRGRVGAALGYVLQDGEAKIVPAVSAFWVHYLDLYRGFWDRDGADLAASLTYINGPLSFGAELKTTAGFEDFNVRSGRVFVNYNFGSKIPVAPSLFASGKWDADITLGLMQGLARELQFHPVTGQTLSQIDWRLSNVVMVTSGLTYRPNDWLTLNAKASTNVAGRSNQSDIDFNVLGCPGNTCVSYSPDTLVNHAWRLDLSARAKVLALGPFSLETIAGYKSESYEWQSFGGVSNYIPVFNNGLQITYDQAWDTPYVGLAERRRRALRSIGSSCRLELGHGVQHRLTSCVGIDLHVICQERENAGVRRQRIVSADRLDENRPRLWQ